MLLRIRPSGYCGQLSLTEPDDFDDMSNEQLLKWVRTHPGQFEVK